MQRRRCQQIALLLGFVHVLNTKLGQLGTQAIKIKPEFPFFQALAGLGLLGHAFFGEPCNCVGVIPR